MVKTKQTMLAQLIAMAVIFFLFLLAIFIVVPILRYLFILFIVVNIVLGFINGKRNIPANITFILLTPLLFIPVLEYFITFILVVLTGIYLVMFWLWYRKGGVEEIKDKKEEKKKKFHFPVWLIVVLIIIAVIFMLLVILALLFFSTTNIGVG